MEGLVEAAETSASGDSAEPSAVNGNIPLSFRQIEFVTSPRWCRNRNGLNQGNRLNSCHVLLAR